MSSDYKAAVDEIAVAAARDLEWFAPPDRKQFLGEAALTAFAMLLLNAFLAGFKKAAEKKAEAAGEKLFTWLWDAISDLLAGRSNALAAAADEHARKAQSASRSLSPKELEEIADETEKQLGALLQTKMPKARAERLAKRIRVSAIAHVVGA